jgi:hypothetical protein
MKGKTMIVSVSLYLVGAFGCLIALSAMILRIGALLGDCPVSAARAKAVAVTIATGYAAIGAGGVILIGALVPLVADAPVVGLFGALGFAALCLGLGFTNAVSTLRAVLAAPLPQPDLNEAADVQA